MNLVKQGKWLAAGVMTLGLCSPAVAVEDESNFYYGIAAGVGEVEPRKGTFSEKASGGSISLGYELSSVLAVEGRLQRLSDKVSVSSAYGYLRIAYPGDYVVPYVMLGAGVTEITAKDATGAKIDFGATSIDEPSTSAAVGISLFGNEETALNFEVSTQASDDILVPFYSIGFQHYFGGHK